MMDPNGDSHNKGDRKNKLFDQNQPGNQGQASSSTLVYTGNQEPESEPMEEDPPNSDMSHGSNVVTTQPTSVQIQPPGVPSIQSSDQHHLQHPDLIQHLIQHPDLIQQIIHYLSQHPDQHPIQHLIQHYAQHQAQQSSQRSPGQNQTQENGGTAGPGGSHLGRLPAAQISVSAPVNSSDETRGHQDLYTSGDQTDSSSTSTMKKSADDSDKQKEDQKSSADAPSDVSVKDPPTDNKEIKPSAPLDVAWFSVKVDWREELPKKWKTLLQTALQSWFNSETNGKCSIEGFKLLDDERTAELGVTPSTDLKDIKTANIKLKNLPETTTVQFQRIQGPTAPPMVVGISSASNDKNQPGLMKKDAGVAPRHTEMIRSSNVPNVPGQTEASDALVVPPTQYWYLNQVYKKEVDKIQNDYGVKMTAETHVSFRSEKTSEKNETDVQNALQAFTALYQDTALNLTFVPIPQTHMESDVIKHVLKNIPNEDHKLMLNMSANNHLLIGPEEMTSPVEKRLRLEPGVEATTWFSNSRSHHMEIDMKPGSSSKQTSQTLDMDIKDTQDSVQMNEQHQKLLEIVFNKEISEIENKYGVQFSSEPGQDSIKVSARSRGTHQVNLEVHALRALTHLYQKVVTSAVTCGLNDDSHSEKVSQALEIIRSKHTCVGGGTRNGCWELFGLQKHLVPAIVDIEKIIGLPVFDEKTKRLLGYPWEFPQASGLQRGNVEMDVMEGAHGPELRGFYKEFHEKGKENVKEKEKEENCSICLDTFIKKTKLKCGHEFCKECLDQSIKSSGEICPLCKNIFGILKGNQPQGTMKVKYCTYTKLPGFPNCGTIIIDYNIPSGLQTDEHPNPGIRYSGAHRTAYLPDNPEGNQVLNLLRRAFDQRLVFTVGVSRTTGVDNTVIWNDIHHKTNTHGGPQNFGYPDSDYFKRVKDELKAKGIE